MFLTLEAPSVQKAWISALQRVFFDGDIIESQYDTGDDFPTRDVTSAIHVTDPLSDPCTMKNGKSLLVNGEVIYCHPGDLYCIEAIKSGYLSEVMTGEMDHYIWENLASYPYTYHDRLFKYRPVNVEDIKHIITEDKEQFLEPSSEAESIGYTFKRSNGFDTIQFELPPVDQIAAAIKQLKKASYTRRAEAITWRPLADNDRDDPPCLQRLWFRVFDGKLRMNAHWRSRDLFGAWEANVNGMLQIGKYVAEQIGVEFGEYFDFCDSLHIYGKKKKVYKELIPLFERVSKNEGLSSTAYDDRLKNWVEDAAKAGLNED